MKHTSHNLEKFFNIRIFFIFFTFLFLCLSIPILSFGLYNEGTIKIQPIYIYTGNQAEKKDLDKADIHLKYSLIYANEIFSQVGIKIESLSPWRSFKEIHDPNDRWGTNPDHIISSREFTLMLNTYGPKVPSGVIPVFFVEHFRVHSDKGDSIVVQANGQTRAESNVPIIKRSGILIDLKNGRFDWIGLSYDILAHELGHFLLNDACFLSNLIDCGHLNEESNLMGAGQVRPRITSHDPKRKVAPTGYLCKIDFLPMSLPPSSGSFDINSVEAMYTRSKYNYSTVPHTNYIQYSPKDPIGKFSMKLLPVSVVPLLIDTQSNDLMVWSVSFPETEISNERMDVEITERKVPFFMPSEQKKAINHAEITVWSRLIEGTYQWSSFLQEEFCIDIFFENHFQYEIPSTLQVPASLEFNLGDIEKYYILELQIDDTEFYEQTVEVYKNYDFTEIEKPDEIPEDIIQFLDYIGLKNFAEDIYHKKDRNVIFIPADELDGAESIRWKFRKKNG